MNYPFTKKMSLGRFLSLALVFALVLSMLSGCSLLPSSGDETTAPTEDTEDTSNIATTEAPTEAPTVATTEAATESMENIAIVKEQTNLLNNPSTGARTKAELDAGDEVEVIRIDAVGTGDAQVKWVYALAIDVNLMGWLLYDDLDMSNVTLDTDSTETPASTGTTIPSDPTIATSATEATTATVSSITGTSTSSDAKYGVVTASELNIRSSASQTADKVGSYTYGDRVAILESSNGWGKTDKGWISLSYVYMDGDVGTNTGYGTVTATQLNVREGPGTTYDVEKTLTQGDRIQVLEQIKIGTTTWGYASGGWVSMDYVTMDGSTTTTGTTTTTTTTTTTGTGVITGSAVNVRSGAGTSYEVVGSKSAGDIVTILETVTAEGYTWGRISEGWIAMNYVSLN